MECISFAKKSVRFPGKQMFPIDGVPIIQIMVSKLQHMQIFGEIIIFTKDPEIRAENATMIEDHTDGIITDSLLTAVKRFGEFFALAGDMPLIDRDFIANMMAQYRGKPLFPVHTDGTIEPLHGIYNFKLLKDMKEYVSVQFS